MLNKVSRNSWGISHENVGMKRGKIIALAVKHHQPLHNTKNGNAAKENKVAQRFQEKSAKLQAQLNSSDYRYESWLSEDVSHGRD